MVPIREPKTYSILLADELTMVREGLAALCEAQTQFRVVAQCSAGVAALRAIETKRPDIAVLDLNLPDLFTLEIVRRAKSKVQPQYPDLARKMNITGTVKIEVMVSPNGMVKGARIVGGHPVLANAALDAARKWRFEPSSAESSGIIDFKFEPR